MISLVFSKGHKGGVSCRPELRTKRTCHLCFHQQSLDEHAS